ncbi:MAG: hypothetical protein R6V77_07280, partial [Candidatus Cloacimonadaceae bacterium]
MKVKYNQRFKGYTGQADRMIYYFDSKSGATLARRMFKFKNHPGQPAFRSAQRQIYALNPDGAYIQNLKDYLIAYNALPENKFSPARSWTNIYNKLMFAMQKALPGQVDLKTITRQQIETQNLPCRTLKS